MREPCRISVHLNADSLGLLLRVCCFRLTAGITKGVTQVDERTNLSLQIAKLACCGHGLNGSRDACLDTFALPLFGNFLSQLLSLAFDVNSFPMTADVA